MVLLDRCHFLSVSLSPLGLRVFSICTMKHRMAQFSLQGCREAGARGTGGRCSAKWGALHERQTGCLVAFHGTFVPEAMRIEISETEEGQGRASVSLPMKW